MKLVIDLTALDDNFTGIERYALNMTLALLRKTVSPGRKVEQEESEYRSGTGKTFELVFNSGRLQKTAF